MRSALACLAGAIVFSATPCVAAPPPATVALTLKDHRFAPATIEVPADARIRIQVTNLDPAYEEFDSDDLHVEEDVPPHGKVAFEVGPLKAGTYDFMGELHSDTAQGRLKAVPATGETKD